MEDVTDATAEGKNTPAANIHLPVQASTCFGAIAQFGTSHITIKDAQNITSKTKNPTPSTNFILSMR